MTDRKPKGSLSVFIFKSKTHFSENTMNASVTLRIVPSEETSPLHSVPKLRRYLVGELTVEDKTDNQFALVAKTDQYNNRDYYSYKVYIQNKYLIFPTSRDTSEAKFFIEAHSFLLRVERIDRIFKLTNNIGIFERVYYVDPEFQVDGRAYDVYSYIPKQLSLQDIFPKVYNFKVSFPDLSPTHAFYNRHGVFVFGKHFKTTLGQQNYFLCWASPDDERIKFIPSSVRRETNFSDIDKYTIESHDNFISCEIDAVKYESTLNREIAYIAPLLYLTYT